MECGTALRLVIDPTLDWLRGFGVPSDDRAAGILMAIAFQESKLTERRQRGGGPAHGFWQFERDGGVWAVLNHPSTAPVALQVCGELGVQPGRDEVHRAIEHNDQLACAFARLLLRSDPHALPVDRGNAWALYLRTWRPGKPRQDAWPVAWTRATVALQADRRRHPAIEPETTG